MEKSLSATVEEFIDQPKDIWHSDITSRVDYTIQGWLQTPEWAQPKQEEPTRWFIDS